MRFRVKGEERELKLRFTPKTITIDMGPAVT